MIKCQMLRLNPMKEWQIVVDEVPLKGSLNMAIDDYLFRSLDEDIPQTYLRFYQWEKPTVSLGYSQKIQKVVDIDYCRQNGIDIVRRITGGKMVLHHREVTYSLCSSDSKTFTSTLSGSYKSISQALIRGLEKMGLAPYLADFPPSSYARGNFPCFSYPARDEIEVGEKKIVGSAQKRVGSRFIQHGSIPLEDDEGLLESVSSLKRGEGRARMTSLSQALGRKVDFRWAVEHLQAGFSEYFEVGFNPKVFNEKEKEVIQRIQKERYNNSEWTYFRNE